jgi:hypothetical protein
VMITPVDFVQPGMGTDPYRVWHRAVPDDSSEKWSSLRVPSASRPVVWGREMTVVA